MKLDREVNARIVVYLLEVISDFLLSPPLVISSIYRRNT